MQAALHRLATRTEPKSDLVFDIWFDSAEAKAGEILRLLPAALPITDIAIEQTDTESIVRQLYEGELSL